jgi:hypothetical protein
LEGSEVNVTRTLKTFAAALLFLLVVSTASAQGGGLTAAKAKDHVGEKSTVCGKVVDSHYASHTRGQPTFLNLDERYPNQIFTIVIWGNDRQKFGDPEAKYREKQVCVTGMITSYKGVPEIAAKEPSQIEVQK